jgi:hypothetical protein
MIVISAGCSRLEGSDLPGDFVFNYRDVRINLQLKPDHTYTEMVISGASRTTHCGTWKYVEHSGYGGNIGLDDFAGPRVRLGSENVQLLQTTFDMPVEACGKTICLIASDDDPVLHFVKQ